MRPTTRFLVLLAAVLTTALLTGAPFAVHAAEESSPAATESPTAAETGEGAEEGGATGAGEGTPAPAEGAGAEGGEEGERTKIEPPLSFSDPQDILGWIILGVAAIAAAAAGRNLVQQMRGERPKADGTWRPR